MTAPGGQAGESDALPISEHGDLYVDRNGDRYTTACFGADGDPWQGALILSQGVVDRLRADGLLPLTEVVRHVSQTAPKRRRWPWGRARTNATPPEVDPS